MSLRFAMTQNLDALLHPEEVPAELHQLLDDWSNIISSDIRGTLIGDRLASTDQGRPAQSGKEGQRLKPEIYGLLSARLSRQDHKAVFSNRVTMHSKFERFGQRFQPFRPNSPGNSYIIFSQVTGQWSPAVIQCIFSHTHEDRSGKCCTETYAHVDEFRRLSPRDTQHDPFRKFSNGGQLFYALHLSAIVIPISSIVGHFAHTALGTEMDFTSEQCIHVLPLLKVRETISS